MKFSLEFFATSRAFQILNVDLSQHISRAVEANAGFASWAVVVCALDDLFADYARFPHAFFRHLRYLFASFEVPTSPD